MLLVAILCWRPDGDTDELVSCGPIYKSCAWSLPEGDLGKIDLQRRFCKDTT